MIDVDEGSLPVALHARHSDDFPVVHLEVDTFEHPATLLGEQREVLNVEQHFVLHR